MESKCTFFITVDSRVECPESVGLCRQCVLCFLDDLIESVRITDGHFRQRLPIECNLGLFEASDELTVAHASHSTGRIDTDDPQSAKLSLSDSTITECVDASSDQRFLYGSEQFASPAAITLGTFEKSFFGSPSCGTFDCSHFLISNTVLSTQGPFELPDSKALYCPCAVQSFVPVST